MIFGTASPRTPATSTLQTASFDSITEVFPIFAHTPEAGTKRDEIDEGLRGFPVGKYIVSYRESGSYVIASRVIHGMRDQKTAYR
jgi:toxin ParE1/3/4